MIEFTVLGSGSSGNASFVRAGEGVDEASGSRGILIDAGLGPRTTRTRLAGHGLDLDDVAAIVLTHADTDHWRESWVRTIVSRGIRVLVSSRHRETAVRRGVPRACCEIVDEAFELEGLRFDPVHVPHDDLGTHGFRITRGNATLGFATDLGRPTRELIDHLRDVDALAIESNYDPELQRRSPRPAFLKARITGGRGHLSNDECLRATATIAGSGELEHVVLLHLSRECNCPDLVASLWRERAPHLAPRVVVSRHDQPTSLLRVHGGRRGGAHTPGSHASDATSDLQLDLFDCA